MRQFRFRDEEESSSGLLLFAVGAIAGLAAGVFVAQRFGGLSELTNRVRERFAREGAEALPGADWDDADEDAYEEDELDEFATAGGEFTSADEELEERVLEAFRNDPVLTERAVDIGAVGDGIIELAGWVHDDDEADHAVTIARGVPGVETVVNRLGLRDDEERFMDAAKRVAEGDPSLTEAHWEGQGVGTGRRRQGSSDEIDRHESPKQNLNDRWMKADEALRNSAEETTASSSSRKAAKKGARVPKADHVTEAEMRAKDASGDSIAD